MGPRPLIGEPLLVIGEPNVQRLKQRRERVVETIGDRQSNRELLERFVDFPNQRRIAVVRTIEFPIECEVVCQVGPAVTRSDVAA